MKCTICGKPVILVPSAAERARKYGETAAYYTALFPTHSECFIAKREAEAMALLQRIKQSQSAMV